MAAFPRIIYIASCIGLGGCISNRGLDDFSGSAPMPLALQEVTIPSSMPWQLTPASTVSAAQGETTIIVASARFGRIKGTPLAVANLEKPVVAFARPGRIVRACKQLIEPQAKQIGAYSVQAAAAGSEKTIDAGRRSQQVFFRIIYDRPAYLEVRQAALRCVIDGRGRIIGAYPV